MTCSASFGIVYGSPIFLWQRAAPIIVGWFTGHKWKKISVSGVPNCLYYWEIFIVYTEFTNVLMGCMLEIHNLAQRRICGM